MNNAYISPGNVHTNAWSMTATEWAVKRLVPVLVITVGAAIGLAAMKQYEGQWRFKKGGRLLPEDADARSFTITPLGFGSLSLKGVTGNFMLSLNQDGRQYSGLLFMIRESGVAGQFSARVRFAPDGNSLTMSVVHFQIGGRKDIVLEAEKLTSN